jgi:predicted hydrocarbon binding protein
MAEIKGILLTAWMDFLKARYGVETVTAAIQELHSDDRLLVSAPFLASSFYPYSSLYALRKLTRRFATPADKNLSVEIGRIMAEYVFTGAYRTLVAKDPVKQVEKISWVKDFFFKDSLILETEVLGASRCVVRYRYDAGAKPTSSICESLKGFWSKTLELAGANQLVATHTTCATKGANCCEFVFDW